MGGGSSSERQIEVYRLLRFPCETNRHSSLRRFPAYVCMYIYVIYSTSIHPELTLAERTIRCFPLTGRNHLWQSPANSVVRYRFRYHAKNLEIGQHAARVVRETGPNSSYRCATWKVLPWPSRRRRTSPCVLDTLCRSFDSHALLVGVPIVCYLCEVRMRNWRVMARRTRPSDRGLYCFPVNAIMMPETLAKVMIHRYVSTV